MTELVRRPAAIRSGSWRTAATVAPMSQTGIDVARGDRAAQAPAPYGLALLELLRVILVAGAFCGVVVAGLGGRLFMFVLRLTSPEGVRGVMTDDGFRVGEFSLANTLGLMTIGAVVGVVGVAAYLLVKPWLFGPLWLRRLTVTLTAGAIGGALLIHPDGTDFRLLEPRWLAVALCVAVPAVFGLVACAVADRVAAPTSWTRRGWPRVALPVLALGSLTVGVIVFVMVAAATALVLALRGLYPAVRSSTPATTVVRAAFLAVAVTGVVGLAHDVREVADLPPSPFAGSR